VAVRERIFAALYDPLGARWEKQYGAELRRKLLGEAHGRVLEIGVGTGHNFAHYPHVDELAGVEPSEPMLQRARKRAAETGRAVSLVNAPAEQLPFENESFDTVVTMAVLCTVDDPERSLREIRRVLRSGGRFRFLEHVRSPDPKLARWQDRLERPWGFVAGGCHPNRRTLEAIEGAGFEVVDLEQGELRGQVPLVRPYVLGTGKKAGV
jgi:ubiquinone/menaquinone biosynthesis C-methylase UbiE